MAGRNLLAAFLEGQGRDALRRTLQHEAFHQFAHNAISPNLPVWLNEGLAQLFEECIWTGTEFWLGQVPPRRLRQLEADVKARRLIDFVTFTGMSSEEWAARLARDHAAGATQYNQSWAMVHFLVNAKDENGKEKYRPRLVRLLELIHNGADPQEAFVQAFSNNYKGFQERFVEYVGDLKATPEATMIEHQGVLADLLTELRSRGQKFSTMSELQSAAVRGRYRLHYTKGQLKWSTEPDLRVYFSDLHGNPFDETALYLEPREDAPLPDIVCRWCEDAQLRTRFFDNGEKLEHVVLVESVQ
jgi:predicted secreted protein